MHETRNFVLVMSLLATFVWAVVAWVILDPDQARLLNVQRFGTLALIVVLTAWLWYALKMEDRLPDHLRETVGHVYYEADGLSFMPIIRVNGMQAELRIYYQNRFENTVEAIVHFRPLQESFVVREGMGDIHFAFRANGGDFGVVSQPIGVPQHLQGEVIELQLAAASYYPRSHGACWRKSAGLPCGTMPVDWSGSALKSGVHEGSNEMELINPVRLHLTMPLDVEESVNVGHGTWKQEQLVAGT